MSSAHRAALKVCLLVDRLGHPVLESAALELTDAHGAAVPTYDQLVIATGSRSFIPPMTGLYRADDRLIPGGFGFRTIDDTRAMLAAAAEHEKAVVVGGGLLGLEAARALQGHGLQVEVVHAGGRTEPATIAGVRAT